MYKPRLTQIALYAVFAILLGVLLIPSGWMRELIPADEVAHFGILAIGFALVFYVPQIVHELSCSPAPRGCVSRRSLDFSTRAPPVQALGLQQSGLAATWHVFS